MNVTVKSNVSLVKMNMFKNIYIYIHPGLPPDDVNRWSRAISAGGEGDSLNVQGYLNMTITE